MYIFIVFFCILMVSTIAYFWKVRHQQVNAIASIVTVIGVLGTFIGIFIGLWGFDTGNIEASVPTLLEGLKLAFITSIVGIGLSILLKGSTLRKRKEQAALEVTNPGTTVDDLAGLLQNILDAEKEEGNKTRETLHSIENSLTGDGDNTVMAQLQNILDSFNEFANKMAEDKTPALIKALEEVMRDFNAKINEQFGDNFKQLNEAVGRINKWQEQYRQQMDELATEFRVAAESIEKSRKSLEGIAKQSGIIVSHIEKSKESLKVIADKNDTIVSSAEKLDPILKALNHQIDMLDKYLTAFSALADKADKAFPIIENRLNQLTKDFSTAVTETITDSDNAIKDQRKALTDQSEQLKKTVKESTDRMAQQITVLDTALKNELTKALNSLGTQLTSLSAKFVEDYTPLTNKLRKVVEIADGSPEPPP